MPTDPERAALAALDELERLAIKVSRGKGCTRSVYIGDERFKVHVAHDELVMELGEKFAPHAPALLSLARRTEQAEDRVAELTEALGYYATKEYNSRTDTDGQLQFVADEALAATGDTQ